MRKLGKIIFPRIRSRLRQPSSCSAHPSRSQLFLTTRFRNTRCWTSQEKNELTSSRKSRRKTQRHYRLRIKWLILLHVGFQITLQILHTGSPTNYPKRKKRSLLMFFLRNRSSWTFLWMWTLRVSVKSQSSRWPGLRGMRDVCTPRSTLTNSEQKKRINLVTSK